MSGMESRLRQLERAMKPQGRDSDNYSDEELLEMLEVFPAVGLALPMPDSLSEALRTLWDRTFGLGEAFRVVGYSPRMLQQAFRHSAEQCGLPLRELSRDEIRQGNPGDPDPGPYSPLAGILARARQR
jgi:hypothetical protein